MTTYGLTTNGFVLKTLQNIKTAIENRIKGSTAWGPNANVSADSEIGQLIGSFADEAAEIWELALYVYNAFYREYATGQSLELVCALIGVTRRPATHSYIPASNMLLTGSVGTIIAAGKIVQVSGTGAQFETDSAVTIGAGGTATVKMVAVESGAIQAAAGQLSQIVTPVAGWSTVSNTDDATVGEPEETDAELRLRATQSLQLGGRSTVGGIRANLEENVDEVIDAKVVENEGDVVDADGRPPHSVECIVDGGDDAEVADEIWNLKAAGIQTCSSVSGDYKIEEIVTDEAGDPHTIIFSRPEIIEAFMHVQLSIDSALFNSGSAQKERCEITYGITGEVFTVIINDVTFSYTQTALDADASDVASGLSAVVNAGDWVPVTASHTAPNDYLDLTSDYPGNYFSLTKTDNVTVTTVTENNGDQQSIIDAIDSYGESHQTIGKDVVLHKYLSPINTADINNAIVGVTIWAKSSRWLNPSPAAGASNLTIAAAQKAVLSTTRITVELI